MHGLDPATIAAAAKEEIRKEQFREAVDREKARLLEYRSPLVRIFPWKITIKIERR